MFRSIIISAIFVSYFTHMCRGYQINPPKKEEENERNSKEAGIFVFFFTPFVLFEISPDTPKRT